MIGPAMFYPSLFFQKFNEGVSSQGRDFLIFQMLSSSLCMYGINIRTNISVGVERPRDLDLIFFGRTGVKGDIKFFEKFI